MKQYFHTIESKKEVYRFAKGEFAEYSDIAITLWGGIPHDVVWAKNNPTYKAELAKRQLLPLLPKLLIIGAKIVIGPKYSKFCGGSLEPGSIITLIQGYFDYDNGLYTETQTAPAIYDEETKDFDSIYHLFGNDLENFMDCQVLKAE